MNVGCFTSYFVIYIDTNGIVQSSLSDSFTITSRIGQSFGSFYHHLIGCQVNRAITLEVNRAITWEVNRAITWDVNRAITWDVNAVFS